MSITAVAAGDYHTVALRNDGSVWTWGGNSYGQLGNDATDYSTTPVQVTALNGMNMTAVTAGAGHTVALKDDGTVWAWGYNNYSQLGINNGWTPLQSLINLGAQKYTVTLMAGANGCINGPSMVNAGTMPTYRITAKPGYHVVDVTVGGVSVGAVSRYAFPTGINADVTITASFAPNHTRRFTIIFKAGDHGSIRGDAHQTVDYGGSTAAITAKPDRGHHFKKWIGAHGVTIGRHSTLKLINVKADQTVTAIFDH